MLDLSLFDLNGLQNLHLSYEHLIETHAKALEENEQLDNPNPLFKYVISEKMKMFEEQITLIRRKIESTVSEQTRYSVENLFFYFGFTQKVIQVHFLTTSKSFKKYGDYVTGRIIYTENEIHKLLQQYKDEIQSDGVIHFECTHLDFRDELKHDLMTQGFLASEISHLY